MALDLNYGNAVTGTQRFARPDLEGRFLRALNSSAGIKMFGLRRIGKSTMRQFAIEHFEQAGRPCIYIDSQGLRSIADLLLKLSLAMPGERGLMGRALAAVGVGPVKTALEALSKGTVYEAAALSGYWQHVSDAIRSALKGDRLKPVLVIDEFSYLIANMVGLGLQGRDDANRLLASMREWRGDGMVMLLTGSIGLTGLARTHGLNIEHLNDLQPFAVPELTKTEAREFIRQATEAPSNGRWTTAHTEEFIKQSGVLYPSFLVRGLLEIGVEYPDTPTAFAGIFSERVRPHLHNDFYNQFDRRFKAYGALPSDEQKTLILPALKAVMEAAEPCPQEAVACDPPFTRVELALALDMLAEDGFIHFTEDGEGERLWKPASRLAKLWWKRSKLS